MRTVLATAVLAAATASAAEFEGVVEYQSTMPMGQVTIHFDVKSPKLRQEMRLPSGAGGAAPVTLMDNEARKMVMLRPARMEYSEMSFPEPNASQQQGTAKPTGKKETILGHPCEQWVYEGAGPHVEMWLA